MNRSVLRHAYGLFTFLLLGALQGADEASRKPPQFYLDKIAPLLTPGEKLVQMAKAAQSEMERQQLYD